MTERPAGPFLDAAELLTIDVGAELRKLAQAQIDGGVRLPAELVRQAMRGGARAIEVWLGRMSLLVRSDDAGLDLSLLRHLAALLDEEAAPARRHRALVGLESAHALPLIALAGVPHTHLRVQAGDGHGLRHRPGRAPEITAGGGGSAEVEIRGLRLGHEARAWLAGACRFTPARVRLDGRDLPRGFADAVAERPLDPPANGGIALPRAGDVARVWLLVDGVVTTHLTVPETLPFEAAVEMGAGAAPAAALRERIEPRLAVLADEALALLLEASRSIRERPAEDQRRLRLLFLAAARKRRRLAEVMALPVFPAFGSAGRSWLSLLEVGQAGRDDATGHRRVNALYPGQDPARHVLPPAPVFVLDAPERSALGQLLGIGFTPLAPRPGGRWLRAALAALGRAASLGLGRALHPLRGLPIPDGSRTPAEQALLAALRPHLAGVTLRAGRGPVRRERGGGWLLPRRNPDVAASASLVARDAAWTYPALLALTDGREGLPENARAIWLARVARSAERR